MMGRTCSPYNSCQAVMWAKYIAMGDRLDPNNPFGWYKVAMNLPGVEEYDCHRPWVFKQMVDGLLDAELLIYVDGGRPIGTTEDLCRESYIRWVSKCSWLGIQYAYRRAQNPSQAPGPWAGEITNTEGGVHGLVFQERGDKTRKLIAELVGI